MNATDIAPAEIAGTTVVHTACTLDCPDVCSLAVTVTDGRITKVDAAPENPVTDGWICAKVRRHAERVYAPERVLTPLMRTGTKGRGQFREASWDEALTTIAARMRSAIDRRGNEAVVAFTYNSSAARTEKASMTEALFAAIGATVVEHTICAHTVGEAWASVFGEMSAADLATAEHSELVVVWGANPNASNTHFGPVLTRAKRRGARIVVIDPRRTPTAARADLHLAIRPGTDVVLAYAVAHQWLRHGHIDRAFIDAHAAGADEFLAAAAEWTPQRAAEVCGLEVDDIITFAQWWGSTRPSLLRLGWGPERNANGGAACRAIMALPVVGGHFGVPGSGIAQSTSVHATSPRVRWPIEALEGPQRRTLPLHQVGQWLAPAAGDPCEVLFVQGANPLVMCPDTRAVMTAFERDDVFTVVHEQVLTDTTRYADVVLPATTSFEIDDIATSYGASVVLPVRAAIGRVGESRTNDEVGLGIARAMGFEWNPPPTVIDDAGPCLVDLACAQFVDTHPDGGRARLVDPVQGVPRYVPVERDMDRYPLTLISPASAKMINSMFGEFQNVSPAIQLHPDDAAPRGLVDGQLVRVDGPAASITVPLEVNADLRVGVALMTKGVWLRQHSDGLGVNALTPATGDALGNGACFNDACVQVSAAGSH
jgi:anaerobic selenocysteine-containing dehydrogenase